MPKIRVDGLNLHYWQSGEGPDVVLVHGLGGNLAGWHMTMVPELQREYRVTTYDLRGHGRSGAPPSGYTTRDMAADLAALLDALNIPQAHVVGHSWGADIALHFALVHPRRVADLVLIEAALLAPLGPLYRSPEWEGWPYVTETLQQLSGSPIPDDKRYDFEYLVRMLIEIPIMYGPAQGRTRSEDVLTRVVDVMRPMWNDEGPGCGLTVESLSGIPHRALALYEANSVCLAALDALRRNMPNVTSAPLPAGKLKHFTGLEYPELILGHMQAFWGASAERGSVYAP